MAVLREDVVRIRFESNKEDLKKLNDDLDKVGKNTDKVGDKTEDAGKRTRNAFQRMADSVKRFINNHPAIQRMVNAVKSLGQAATWAFNCLKKLASISFKALTAGISAASAAVGYLTKSSVSAYANTEQLIGGVETLFGAGGDSIEEYAKSVGMSVDEASYKYKDLMYAQETVFKNANDAYKKSGLSANDYMETVTGFSASLISSLGGDTKKAADYANTAIIDMSD